MPKCSGPTSWTRSWMTPRGFCKTSDRRVRPRLRVRVAAIGYLHERGRGTLPDSLRRHSGRGQVMFLFLRPHIPGESQEELEWLFVPPEEGQHRRPGGLLGGVSAARFTPRSAGG